MTAAVTDAGTIITREKLGSREGYQVFVKVHRWSEKRLKDHPETGGLMDVPAGKLRKTRGQVDADYKAIRRFVRLAKAALGKCA